MERGLHFGNVSISLVLLLLLKALTGFGTSLTHGSAIGREPQSAARGSGSTSEDDGAGVMKRGLGNVGAPVIVADVTVEDDDNGSAGESDESYGESNGNFRPTRCVQVHTASFRAGHPLSDHFTCATVEGSTPSENLCCTLFITQKICV